MVLLADAVEEKKLDVRMIERNLARGRLSQEELEKASKKIPDDAENAQWVNPENLADEG